MADGPKDERLLVLSTLPATRVARRLALAIVMLSLAVFTAAAPFARVKLPSIAAFIPSYAAALVVTDLVTAALLFGQFAIGRSRALLLLASGYVFIALITISHALTFPGLFSETGLLGAGSQSAAWLYIFWHGGFPAAVLGYALLRDGTARLIRHPAPTAIVGSLAAVAGVVVVLTMLATAGEASLPVIMQGHHYTPIMIFIVSAVWALSLLALLVLFIRRPHSVLDVWLMVALCVWLCDIALSAVLNAGRFDLGFYVGRVYGLAAASFVLVVLLLETIALYARLARSAELDRREREQRLSELHAELIHVSRLSELGQMVAALAHEVSQPLTAIGNYVRASQRLLRNGDAANAETALDKASDETTRATAIIRRLRDFIKKQDSVRRAEDLAVVLEEAVALTMVGADRRDVSVAMRVDPGASVALIDKIQVQQVVLNLVRNAVEAMADGMRPALVIATTASADDTIEVSVADSGPGLDAEVRAKLFQPFVTTKSEGMGVGLSICQSIVEAHGGRIWAEDNPGGGTVFRFTVPGMLSSERLAAAE